jgi:hypothetical protein
MDSGKSIPRLVAHGTPPLQIFLAGELDPREGAGEEGGGGGGTRAGGGAGGGESTRTTLRSPCNDDFIW